MFDELALRRLYYQAADSYPQLHWSVLSAVSVWESGKACGFDHPLQRLTANAATVACALNAAPQCHNDYLWPIHPSAV
jgi:hypothetical protein